MTKIKDHTLSLQFMQNNPIEAILVVDPQTSTVLANAALKKMLDFNDVKTLDEALPCLSSKGTEQKMIKERINSRDNSRCDKPIKLYKDDHHYHLFFYFEPDEEITTVHVRDMDKLDKLSAQLKEYAQGLVVNIYELEKAKKKVEIHNTELQEQVTTRELAEGLLKQSLDNMNRIIYKMIDTISLIGIIKDPYTGMHQHRVAFLSKAIAEEMDLHPEQIQGIYIAAMLHDIGKISIPTEILSKPGKITDAEFELIKSHPKMSYEILKQIEFSWPVAKITLQHHEKLDGTGYPEGISGDDILLEARIITVADIVEAISSHRPYRKGLGIDFAIDVITKGKGTAYDPEVVDTCIKLFREKGYDFEEAMKNIKSSFDF